VQFACRVIFLTGYCRTLGRLRLPLMVSGFAKRGLQGYNKSKETETSKQLDDFLKHKCPRFAKPLFRVVHLLF
jgi:hypothetical protein